MSDVARRFANSIAEHEMTVAHDDGNYRHIQFRHTGKHYRGYYWFDLITVPGALIFRGDGESFVFSREEDMFGFFRGSAWEGRPNVSYWAEKVTSDRARLERYNEDLFKQAVNAAVASYYEPDAAPEDLVRKVADDIIEYGDTYREEDALRLVSEFAWYEDPDDEWKPNKRPDFTFSEPWEWRIRDYDWWFLWSLEAILWGIGKYDEAHGRKSRYVSAPPTVVDVQLPDHPDEQPPGRRVETVTPAGGVL